MSQIVVEAPVQMHSSRSNAVAWVLQVLAAVAFLGAGSAKLAGAEPMVESFEKIGVGQWFRVLTGALEITGAIGLLIPRVRFLAALALAAVMFCAIIAHLTVLGGSPAGAVILFAILVTIAYLRRP